MIDQHSKDIKKWSDWLEGIERLTRASILSCFKNREIGKWKEDLITSEILTKLNDLKPEPLSAGNIYRSVNWRGYKFSGNAEKSMVTLL